LGPMKGDSPGNYGPMNAGGVELAGEGRGARRGGRRVSVGAVRVLR
jgi:hypothetical protein